MYTKSLLTVALMSCSLSSCNDDDQRLNDADVDVSDAERVDADDAEADGESDQEADGDLDGSADSGFVLDGNYDDWVNGEDNFVVGDADIVVVGETHTGWQQARCFECHGVLAPNEVFGHNPRMQYWSWSCSRGFPGAECHGHGVNGTSPFNHGDDPYFTGCTKSGCHDQYNTELVDNENHGFTNAPDVFCQACHDYYWVDWSEM